MEGWPGCSWGSVSLRAREATRRRRPEHVVPPALEEEDERLKIDARIQQLTCQNHLLTKFTMTCVGFDLLAHISASKNVAYI